MTSISTFQRDQKALRTQQKALNAQFAAKVTLEGGGGTFDAATFLPVDPRTRGYAVAIRPDLEMTIPVHSGFLGHTAFYNSAENIAQELVNYSDLIPSGTFVGTWFDTEAHAFVFDAIVILRDYDDAMTVAKALGQKAIWDFGLKTELAVEPATRADRPAL